MSRNKQLGLTLIELLIAAAILILLFIISFISWRNHIDKANDAKRKDDLQKLSIAFEEYFSDNECYPASDILEVCQGSQLEPYLNSIPCDPTYNIPYCYVVDEDNPSCYGNYRILSPLQNQSDPIITQKDCHGEEYCGYESLCAVPNISGYNYGVNSFNVTLLNPDVSPPADPSPSPPGPSPSATSSPSPSPGLYACDPNGICNSYEDTGTCGITFSDQVYCNTYCPTSDPSERCAY